MAIVADGNRRWAYAHGLPVLDGYRAGANTLAARVRDAAELGVEQLTVYAFSTENWLRPTEEVQELVGMIGRRVEREAPKLHSEGVRMRFVGRREGVPAGLVEQMDRAQRLTEANCGMTLFVAFNYGGRAEIIDAAKRFEGCTEREFRECLYVPDMEDPDLIIRTGGEQRMSNYLLWQAAYSELVFRRELWPDFSRADLRECLRELGDRRRRFGRR